MNIQHRTISAENRRVFGPLLDAIQDLHAQGHRLPLRGSVQELLLRSNRSFYPHEGYKTFREYYNAACEKQIIRLGCLDKRPSHCLLVRPSQYSFQRAKTT